MSNISAETMNHKQVSVFTDSPSVPAGVSENHAYKWPPAGKHLTSTSESDLQHEWTNILNVCNLLKSVIKQIIQMHTDCIVIIHYLPY